MARRGTTLGQEQTVLMVTKTYPLPSETYVETTCVAGMDKDGNLVRVYPVPFRLLEGAKRFKRWQWVTARFTPPSSDHRPESRRIDQETIVLGPTIGTEHLWRERMQLIAPHIVPSFAQLEARRKSTGQTLGFLRPARLVGLDIKLLPPRKRNWSPKELAHLTRDLTQDPLFEKGSVPPRNILEKIPFDFHYRYEIDTPNGPEKLRHIINDWEAGALYRNCVEQHGEDWELPFRNKYFAEFSQKDLVFMMGTMHRIPHQWLIIGIVYPPKPPTPSIMQPILDL